MTGEEAFDEIKEEEKYNKKGRYLDKFDISLTPSSPLLNVVPTEGEDFFFTKVCHIVCISGPVDTPFDTNTINRDLDRLRETYEFFAKYECHFIIDQDSEDFGEESEVTDIEQAFQTIIDNNDDFEDLGFTYHGPVEADRLKELIQGIVDEFLGTEDEG